MAAEKILVVDDDNNICELLRLYLVNGLALKFGQLLVCLTDSCGNAFNVFAGKCFQ